MLRKNEYENKIGCTVKYMIHTLQIGFETQRTIVFVLMHIRRNANQNRDLTAQKCNARLPVCTKKLAQIRDDTEH
jgi:hypothetical protein